MIQNDKQIMTDVRIEERLRCLSEASFEAIAIHDNGRIMEVNSTFTQMFGYEYPEIIGMHTLQFAAPESHDSVLQNIVTAYEGPYEAVCIRKNGSTFTAEIRGKSIMHQGRMASVAAIRDITWIKQAEEELRNNHSNLLTLYKVSAAISQTISLDKLFDIVLDTVTGLNIFNAERKGGIFIVEGNRMKLVSHLGHSDNFLELHKNMKVGECLCGLAVKTGEVIISRNSDNDIRHTIRYPGIHSHGHIIIPLKARYTVVGILYLYLPADFDIDESRLNLLTSIGNQIGIAIDNARLYEETKTSSLIDPLTGLANRRMMNILFEKYFAGARRSGTPLSIIMLDIDHFKKYNDKYGHASGDRLLTGLGKLLLRVIREADLAVRYGGEEFLILLPETDLIEASEIAERIRGTVETTLAITASLGVASCNLNIVKPEKFIEKADEALYRAKKNGRNRVEVS
jgi:diguanylate cyclase (GGDEF)-like protein/PAS domain S-box-containing protein